MIGTINGAYLNRFAVNANLVSGLSFADAVFTQANATTSAAGVTATAAAATMTEAAYTLSAAAANALAAAAAWTEAAHALSAAATAAIGSSLSATNDAQGFGGASTGAVAALLSAIAAGDTLEAVAEAEAIKAVLDFIQQAQTLTAAGTVATGADLDALTADQAGNLSGIASIGALMTAANDADTLAALLRMLARHSAGVDVVPHGHAGALTPHTSGSGLTPHASGNALARHLAGNSLTVH